MKELVKSGLFSLGFAIVVGIGGYAASYTVPEQWRAEVEIEKPTIEQLGNYFALHSMYQLISENQSATDSNFAKDVVQQVYQEFKQQVQSYDNLHKFWQNSNFYQQRQTNIEERDQALLTQLIENTQFVEARTDKNGRDRILLVLDNPKQATEVLTQFVSNMNEQTKQKLYQELIVKWKTLFNQVRLAAEVSQSDNAQNTINWAGKLTMMKSVSPLDNQLMSFHYLKSPTKAEVVLPNRIVWAGIGTLAGMILGGLFCLLLFRYKNKK